MTAPRAETWRQLVRRLNIDPEGFIRIVVETSDDGDGSGARHVIARGDDATEVVRLLQRAAADVTNDVLDAVLVNHDLYQLRAVFGDSASWVASLILQAADDGQHHD